MEQQFNTEEILKTTEFTDFYKTAIDFCDFIENYSSKENVEFLKAQEYTYLSFTLMR